ncbi:MAG: AAA family ATPase [Proteobacteria bacterium]|nr:AAA family ATPase [Pseudomonadota bacterium]
MHAHLNALFAALTAEEQHQRAEHQRLSSGTRAERISGGFSWPPLRTTDVTQRGWTWRLELTGPKGALLHDGIGPGDPVKLGPLGGGSRSVDGKVRDVDGNCAEVQLLFDRATQDQMRLDAAGGGDVLPGWLRGELDVTRRYDPTTFIRYRNSLRRIVPKSSALAQALLDPSGDEGPEPPDAEELAALWPELDDAQATAAWHGWKAPALALIHGPPGTGKTWLLARLLKRLVGEGDRPWALADSNAAVDNLTLACAAVGLRVLRLGAQGRISAAARPYSLDEALRTTPLSAAIRDVQKEIDDLHSRRPRGMGRRLRELFDARRRLQDQARTHAIESADVLAITFGSLTRWGDELPPARTAVVDEATQAMEPAIWTAVPYIDRLVLVGDPHQLGPVVTQPGSTLEQSLLDRLLDSDVPLRPLHVQHRMHAAIGACVQDVYGDAYQPAEGIADRALDQLPDVTAGTATERPVLWIDTAGSGLDEARDPVTMSMFNAGEVELAGLAVARLREAGVRAEDIAVIAPYSAQIGRLRAREELAGVEVATVNAFQGREQEAIVCTFVRSNPRGELGFVEDGRRLTVSLTRARRQLICIGDSSTLAASPRYAALFEHLEGTAALQSIWEPPWNACLPG